MPKLFGTVGTQAPKFTTQSGSIVAKNLDAFRGHVQHATHAASGGWGGTKAFVDLNQLRNSVAQTRDPELRAVMNRVDQHFSVPARVADGNGGFKMVRQAPARLAPNQVNELMGSLAQGKAAGMAMAGSDGKISEAEARNGAGWTKSPKLANQVAGAVAGSLVQRSDVQKANFKEAARSELSGRKAIEQDISAFATKHAETPQGRDALAWHLRSEIVKRPGANLGSMIAADSLENRALKADAQAPMLLAGMRTKNNISDAELKTFLRTDNLATFTAQAKASADRTVGGSYEKYVAGADIQAALKPR
jgi:hypothetical protein